MLTADQLDALTGPITDLYEQYNQSVINDISRRLAKMGKVTETAAWQMQRLIESGKVYENALKELAKTSGLSEVEMRKMFEAAGVKAMRFDDSIYKAAGLNPLPLNLSPAMAQVLAAGLRKTNGVVKNLTMTTAINAQHSFIQAADLAYMQVAGGAMSYDQAIRAAILNVAENGLHTINYTSGHKDKLDVAMRRTVLTGVSQTTGNLQIARADEMGTDLVQTSAHIGARPEHQLWQGKVFSRSGASRQYPTFVLSTGYGTGVGLCGWNCRHSFYPFFEGISENAYNQAELDSFANETVTYNGQEIPIYDATQMQRGIERKIRLWKRKEGALDAGGLDNVVEAEKVKVWQARMRDFIKQTGLQRQSVREQVVGVGRFGTAKLPAVIPPAPAPILVSVPAPVPAAPVIPVPVPVTPQGVPLPPVGLPLSSNVKPLSNLTGPDPIRVSEDGTRIQKSLYAMPSKGAFESEMVTIEGNGDAVLKTNTSKLPFGWGPCDTQEGFAKREVMCSKLDEALGLNVVPKTTAFIENGEYYSLQRFVDNSIDGDSAISQFGGEGSLFATLSDKSEPGKIMLLDAIMANPDRHGSNWLYSGGHIFSIDNGLGMVMLGSDV